MDKKEIIRYMANIAMISVVDGEVSPLEAEAINNICEEIGASEDELKKSLNAVAQGNIQIEPVGRFSEKIRNLEDMIFVSLYDGEFSELEKPEILSFAKSVKITQDQLSEILSEAKFRIRSKKPSNVCPSCGGDIEAETNFCRHCGKKLAS